MAEGFYRMTKVISYVLGICLYLNVGIMHAAQEIDHLFVIVVPSYNNSAWCKKNLHSIFDQKYTNYYVIYIDDCSTDMTYDMVTDLVSQRGMEHKVILISNKKRLGALANHYKAVHMCQDHHIIVQLDGDDWFKHDDVLGYLNKVYQDPNVWLTYGQFEIYPYSKGKVASELPQHTITSSSYRQSEWVTSALRTFYAGLCKRVDRQDLLDEGEFFAYTCDMALMFPMLEMAAGKIRFINELLYVYNCMNPINDFKKDVLGQLNCERLIRNKTKYAPLIKAPYCLPAQLLHDECQ